MTDDCCSDADTAGRGLNPEMKNPFADGVSRRRLLQASAAGTTAAVAGCLGGDGGGGEPTLFVFNTGDRTVSVIDTETDELLTTNFVGTTASFPANQYGTAAEDGYDTLWLNVDGGVTALDQESLDVVAEVDTGIGANYQNVTPDGGHLIVASGGSLSMAPDPDDPPTHTYTRVDADRGSDSFGEVTGSIEVGYTGPCDMTVGPDGEYAFAVDVADESLTVLQVDPFEIATQVDVGESIVDDSNVLPFMCTASFDGEYLLVENGEGTLGPEGEQTGSESIWDISDPTAPEELAKLTPEDGLPGLPITSEIGPDSETAYLFIPAAGGVGVVDIESQTYQETLDIGGAALSAAWGPNREKLYVPVQTENEVAVVDHEQQEVTTTVEAGEAPVGAVAGTVRPEEDTTSNVQAQLAMLGVEVGALQSTYCYPKCFCGRDQ
jgi:DNA-binding beta-propeller fold protein YncE